MSAPATKAMTIRAKPDQHAVGLHNAGQRLALFQPLIPRGERSGLLTHIAMTESVSLCERMKS
jgi:hypothetical protein